MAEWRQYFLQYFPSLFLPLSEPRSCGVQTPQLRPISFLINDTNYRALNSMCLRMGEDTQTTISLSLNSLFISLVFFLPPYHSPLAQRSWASHTIITGSISQQPLFFFQPLVCSLCAPSGTYSISSLVSSFCLHRFLALSYWEAAMLSHNLHNAGCVLCVCVCGRACMSLSLCFSLSIWGTGARTWRSSSLLSKWDRPTKGEKTNAA